MWWALASKTRQSYDTTLRSYTENCRFHGVPPFPATAHSLADWVGGLGQRHLKTRTIKAYITGIRSAQLDMGATRTKLEIFHHLALERIVTGIKKLQGEAGRKERCPITRPILLRLLARLDKSSLEGATLHAAYSLAFATFLRRGKFIWSKSEWDNGDFQQWHASRGSILLEEDKLQFSLPASKSDPFRQGVTITVAKAADEGCAIASIKNLFARFPMPHSSPLFNSSGGNAFTRQYVTRVLRSLLQELGYTGHYAGHSFRRGAATWARERGLTDAEI